MAMSVCKHNHSGDKWSEVIEGSGLVCAQTEGHTVNSNDTKNTKPVLEAILLQFATPKVKRDTPGDMSYGVVKHKPCMHE